MAGRYAVIKIKRVEPEVFWILYLDTELPKGQFLKSSADLSETELREEIEEDEVLGTGNQFHDSAGAGQPRLSARRPARS